VVKKLALSIFITKKRLMRQAPRLEKPARRLLEGCLSVDRTETCMSA